MSSIFSLTLIPPANYYWVGGAAQTVHKRFLTQLTLRFRRGTVPPFDLGTRSAIIVGSSFGREQVNLDALNKHRIDREKCE